MMGVHAAALRDAGARVSIIAGRGRASPSGVQLVRIAEIDSKNARVLRDFASLARGEMGADHGRLADDIYSRLRPHVARTDRVVVHNAFTMHKNPALTAALERLAREHPGRFIAWTHDIAWADPQYAAQRHSGEPWDRLARAVAGVRYVAVSDERRRQLADALGVRRSAIAVVPNGIDIAATLGLSPAGARLAARLGLFDASPLLLLPARLTRRKRVEAAIAALPLVRKRWPRAALVVTGTPGAHNATNERYASELRAMATEGVHLLHALGIRATYRVVADLYALADALVLPSASEGFGIPLLEAGLHRLPVVCSDIPALRAIGCDDVTYVAPDADGAAIAAATLRRMDGDPAARLRVRARAHAWPRVLAELALPLILADPRSPARTPAGRRGATGRTRRADPPGYSERLARAKAR